MPSAIPQSPSRIDAPRPLAPTRSRGRRRLAAPLLAAAAAGYALLAPVPARGEDRPVPLQDLVEPPELCPDDDGVLDLTLEVRFAESWVDAAESAAGIERRRKTLRSYHLHPDTRARPCDGRDREPARGPLIPGPTLRLRKSDRGTTNGTRLRLRLINSLDPGQPPWVCNEARNFRPGGRVPPVNGRCERAAFPLTDQVWPACFHGDNVTNLHYHGFHVSPQAPQDDVLLMVEPGASYRYALDPLPFTQAEGTHWYHPHKHGSTALQVLSGMAGAVVVEGPFDDWLAGFFAEQGHALEDRVLVVQQIDDGIEHFKRFDPMILAKLDANDDPVKENGKIVPCRPEDPPESCGCTPGATYDPPYPAVNGRINPVVTLRPGEVQRWRLVGATMQASAHLAIRFHPALEVAQIAQDGVRFAPETFRDQPLFDPPMHAPGSDPGITDFLLAPGNRADFLVRAPLDAAPGTLLAVAHDTVGHVDPEVEELLDARDRVAHRDLTAAAEAVRTAAQGGVEEDPALLTVRVAGAPKPMRLPEAREWPPLPGFLEELGAPDRRREVEFSMGDTSPAQANNRFYIDGVQYCPGCANVTMSLGSVEEWRITNVSKPNHPFHIHVNPFQVRKVFGLYDPKPGTETIPIFAEYDPPIWGDTIALPGPGCVPVPDTGGGCAGVCAGWGGRLAGPDDDCETPAAGRCPCYADAGSVVIRQALRDFTGEYVIHCHILGHEDRGMMLNVQTVCPEPHGTSYGEPSPGRPECRAGDPLTPAAPRCPASYATGPRCYEEPAAPEPAAGHSNTTPTASPRRSPSRE